MPTDDTAKSSGSALCESVHTDDLSLKSMVCLGQQTIVVNRLAPRPWLLFARRNEFVRVLDAKGIAMKWSLIVMLVGVVGVIAALQGCAHSGGYPGGCRNGRCTAPPRSPAAVSPYNGMESGAPTYAPPAGSGTR